MALAVKVYMLLITASIYLYTVSSVSTSKALAKLNKNRGLFNKINNGCYSFQFQRSCFCFPCYTQQMNVNVVDNKATSVTFAEGNNFALNNICYNNEDALNGALQDAAKTIPDLFDEIEYQLNNGWSVNVQYHKDIGIPLSISFDLIQPEGEPQIADDEYFYYINCIQFDAKCSPSSRRKSQKHRRIHRFHKNDPYSCNNVEIPESCPSPDAGLGVVAFECNRFSDGCNTCSCDGTEIVGCTKRVCKEEEYGAEKCLDCESNTQWTECGGVCNPTCKDDLLCGIRFIVAPGCGAPRCQCPASHPYWDGYECVDEKECGITPITPSPIPFIPDSFCPEHCNVFNDGCEQCQCDADGNSFNCESIGGIGACELPFRLNAVCTECEDPETMEYNSCGTCTTTCKQLLSNQLFACIAVCQQKCQCKPDTPYYDEDQGKCVTEAECRGGTVEPEETPCSDVDHCIEYTDGCVSCSCPGGDIGPFMCFAVDPECIPGPNANCLTCEDEETMEYTTCGGCDVTCNDGPVVPCTLECKQKCQCKKETPIYSEDEGKCITLDECPPQEPCCDPVTEPGANGNPICFEGHRCCPDGTWTCGNGDGSFSCNGQVTNTFGTVCDNGGPILVIPPLVV